MIEIREIERYILELLVGRECCDNISYQTRTNSKAKLIIIPSNFFNQGVYGTLQTLPSLPFKKLPDSDIPFLFGEEKIEQLSDSRIVLYADLVASAFFLLSRYEEMIKPGCRDQHGRFLAKDSIVFQQGYGMRPLVDEWGRYLRALLHSVSVNVPVEQFGFQKIYLTHDVDTPFLFWRKEQIIKQYVKNLIGRGKKIEYPFYIYNHPEKDSQSNFERIIETDTRFIRLCENDSVESVYFLIAAGSKKTKSYCNIQLKKFQNLITMLHNAGATLGLHVSYEAGKSPNLIQQEMKRLLDKCPNSCTKSRHHYLRWIEPEHIDSMELGGITEDFTLGYADSVGFRVGTCRPYRFINPMTVKVTNILVHPMQIMECSLGHQNYMNLSYESALKISKSLIDMTYEFNGEIVLLFHNPIWSEDSYYGDLYDNLLDYIVDIRGQKTSFLKGKTNDITSTIE